MAEENPAPEKVFHFTDIFTYEHPVKKGDDEKKWGLTLSVSGSRKKGNTDSLDTGYSAQVKYDDNITNFRAGFTGAYGESAGKMDENRGTATLNLDHYLFWHVEFFSYTMSDYNRMTELRHRNDSGAGLKFVFIRNSYLLVDLSGAPVLQYEKHDELDKVVDWRWSVRGRIEFFPFDDDFVVRYYTYYIVKMENRDVYRTIHDVYLYKKIIGILGVRAGFRREYDTHTREYLLQHPRVKKVDRIYYLQATITI